MTAAAHTVYVVLDDDPTGTQSVANVPVLASWEPQDFLWAFKQPAAAIYVLTNSRSLDAGSAARVNREVVATALAHRPDDVRLEFVSRSDSTLRGHFPLETDVIEQERGRAGLAPVDALLLVPAFPEAGRITREGVHYARDAAGTYVPIGQSEYARDATFGYTNSDLRKWVAEKSRGRVSADAVTALSLAQIRGDADVLVETLNTVTGVVSVDCETPDDLVRLAQGVRSATAAGRRFLYRVGPPFVRAIIDQAPQPPVSPAMIDSIRGSSSQVDVAGGLVVVGSHVPTTTRQLAALRRRHDAIDVQVEVSSVLDAATRDQHLAEVVGHLVEALPVSDAVLSTSRTLISTADREKSLDVARQVSAAVAHVVQAVLASRRPRFVVAKGGITSSDVATRGLGIRRAWAHGSMLPGLASLWSAADGPATGIPYVVFPGNVGDDDALSDVVDRLVRRRRPVRGVDPRA